MDDLFRALLRDPGNRGILLVYADHLEGLGDPRAPYARAQLNQREGRGPGLQHLRELYPHAHPGWVGQLELAGVFVHNLLPIEAAWWGVGVGSQENPGTYRAFPNVERPPVPHHRFDGSFDWLRSWHTEFPGRTEADPAGWSRRLDSLAAEGHAVPQALRAFLAEPELHRAIPSCTDNFVLGARDTALCDTPAGPVLPFYCDQQWCVVWGVRLGTGRDAYGPVVSGIPTFGEAGFEGLEDVVFAESSLEAFLYRWRIENDIWYATESEERELTETEAAYAAFF